MKSDNQEWPRNAIESVSAIIAVVIGICGVVAGLLLGVVLTMGIDLCGAGTACNWWAGLGVMVAVLGIWLPSFSVAAAVIWAGLLLSKAYQWCRHRRPGPS